MNLNVVSVGQLARHLISFAFIAAWSTQLAAATPPLPEKDGLKHLGVASCSTGLCHGKKKAVEGGDVPLTESESWYVEEHAFAYSNLRTDESRLIAKKLGIPNAHTSDLCLDCHADNVEIERQGEKFEISEGIGCEACHGGAENWRRTHTDKDNTHAMNIENGMYPTDLPFARAELCLSCHLGTKDKFATHAIMGAGHPRLAFELQTFTERQPEHFTVDEDYVNRKQYNPPVFMWIVGLTQTSINTVDMIDSSMFSDGTMFPELSFFDCHSCHHSMQERRYSKTSMEESIAPGSVRINDGSLQILAAITSVIAPALEEKLTNNIISMHKTVKKGTGRSLKLTDLKATLASIKEVIKGKTYSEVDMQQIRNVLAATASKGDYRDYTSAEQAVMGFETLSYSIGDDEKYAEFIMTLYNSMSDENTFNPQAFATAFAKYQAE